MPLHRIAQRSPPATSGSQDLAPASHDESMTTSNFDTDIDMEQLRQSKTCDGGCCDHSSGCKCGGCFCNVRAHLQLNENQTTYSGEGGNYVATDYNQRNLGANNDAGVQALAVNMASLRTDSSSLPMNIGPPSFDTLRQRDAHQSYDEHMRLNIQRLGINLDDDGMSDTEYPGDEFVSPTLPKSDCGLELIFEFEPHELSRVNSHELPPNTLSYGARDSSRNPSIAVQGVGGLFDTNSVANRSQYSLEMSLCFYPLVVVPDCRHAANCA